MTQALIWAAAGTGFTFLMTSLGAAMVFFLRRRSGEAMQRIFLGFAAGVMIAASVWSLLIPAIEEAEAAGGIGWVPAAGGFVLGILLMLALDGLLPQADVVALMLPHSPQTEGLMDARRLRLMKEDAILLSMGRGSVLDQEALAAVMGEGRLWGAALDVTVPEPLPQDSPLWTIPNLIITPHSAGGMRLEVTRANCVRQALDNLNRWQAGKPLENLVRR